ncbi:MAG: stage II sporulation protein M, partial [Hyphomonadaceae bacterium]|nr:stage II sporulation protein M [Hyphomonadaceae bacterium]
RRTQSTAARAPLEARYGRLHATVNVSAIRWRYATWSLFRDQIPAALLAMRAHLVWVTLWFILCVLAGGWLVSSYPNLIALFASPDMIATVERGDLWTDSLLNVTPSSILSVDLLTNNIVVALFAFVSGFLFGLGTLYLIGTNGLLIGALFAFTADHGLSDRLFQFIIAHGPVELSCICLAGAAGSYAGESLFRSPPGERSAAFAAASKEGGKVLLAVSLLLLGCGYIEGYISPNLDIPLLPRMVIGIGYFLFMLALLRGYLAGRSRDRRPLNV